MTDDREKAGLSKALFSAGLSRREFIKTSAIVTGGIASGFLITCEGESMASTENAQKYHNKMLPGYDSPLMKTDPEFVERFDNFAFDEVVNSDDLDDRTRFMAILATLLGCQGMDEFKVMLGAALNFGLSPVECKEIVYQAVAYPGIGRVIPFLAITNEVLKKRGVKLPQIYPEAEILQVLAIIGHEAEQSDVLLENWTHQLGFTK